MAQEKQPLLFGAHMSIAGGIEQAIYRGANIGCSAIQIFTHNNRQWFDRKRSQTDITHFKTTQKHSPVKNVVAHASYLINLGSPSFETNKKSVQALHHELENCNRLQIPYLVLHPGAYISTNKQKALDTIASNLQTVLKKTENTKILLETMAGQGTTVGNTFQELHYLLAQLPQFKDRLGICFDTCHVFSAGYDLRTETAYEETINEFDYYIGLKQIEVFHVNDSKHDLGSHNDRHEHIGKGKIGTTAFSLLMNDPRFFACPKILETPKKCPNDDAKNIKQLYTMLSKETREQLYIPDETIQAIHNL